MTMKTSETDSGKKKYMYKERNGYCTLFCTLAPVSKQTASKTFQYFVKKIIRSGFYKDIEINKS